MPAAVQSLAISLRGMGRQGDDRNTSLSAALLIADVLVAVIAVHDGHGNIHEHNVVRLPLECRDRFLSIADNRDRVSSSLQHAL